MLIVTHSHALVVVFLFPVPRMPLLLVPSVMLIIGIAHILVVVMVPHCMWLMVNLVRVIVMGIQGSIVMEGVVHPIKSRTPIHMKSRVSEIGLCSPMISIVGYSRRAPQITLIINVQATIACVP